MISGIENDKSGNTVKSKRDEFIFEIRRSKNEELLNAKRFKFTSKIQQQLTELAQAESTIELQNLAKAFTDSLAEKNFEAIANALHIIRKKISHSDNELLKAFASTNICQSICDLLDVKYKIFPKIQLEASWILTNLASGKSEETTYVVSLGSIPRFVNLITNENDEISEQALWAIANIAGDNNQNRDLCLDAGVVNSIIEKINGKNFTVSYIRILTWAMSNLCRGKPYPSYEKVSDFLLLIGKLIYVKDDEILINIMWCLSYLSDGENERIDDVLKLGIVENIVECLNNKNLLLITPSLRTVGNLITGTDQQTEIVLKTNVLTYLSSLLTNTKKVFRREVCWTISNILAGNYMQIQHVLDSAKSIIPKLIFIIYNDEPDVKLEALYCFSNVTYGGTIEQVNQLVELNIIEVLCDAISNTDNTNIIIAALDSIFNILKMGNNFILQGTHQMNPYTVKLENCGGIKLIENLQSHTDTRIYERLSNIIDSFFEVE